MYVNKVKRTVAVKSEMHDGGKGYFFYKTEMVSFTCQLDPFRITWEKPTEIICEGLSYVH